jgi:hypothetical protein
MLTYVGKGYNPAFTDNYDKVIARLVAGEDIVIQTGPDDICQPLLATNEPHCFRDSVLERDAKATQDVGQLLGRPLQAGDIIDLHGLMLDQFRDAFARGVTRSACTGCEWFDLCSRVAETGYSETRLKRARKHCDS